MGSSFLQNDTAFWAGIGNSASRILLPKGKKLTTLRDAALYITKLPKAEHDADGWQAAMSGMIG